MALNKSNIKTYLVSVKTNITYLLQVNGVAPVSSSRFKTVEQIVLLLSSRLLGRFSPLALKGGKTNLPTISRMTGREISTVTGGKSKLNLGARITGKETVLSVFHLVLSLPMKLKLRSTALITAGKTKLNLSPLLGVFNTLGTWDGDTLATPDALTLGDVDFTAT